MIQIKSAAEIKTMMKATELSAAALVLAGKSIKAGMSTLDLDKIIAKFISENGAKASFLHYNGFSGNACISVNEELIHGIPSKGKIIHEGDIVTVDVGAHIDGFHGDNAATFVCGSVPESTLKLLRITEESLYEGIKMAIPGNRIGDISHAIEQHCTAAGYFMVKRYVGHGVGRDLHEDPEVPNFGAAGRGPRLVPGMVIAIEPMVNATTESIKVMPNKWTVVEGNGNLCAHFEHTIAITNAEPLIMTINQHEF